MIGSSSKVPARGVVELHVRSRRLGRLLQAGTWEGGRRGAGQAQKVGMTVTRHIEMNANNSMQVSSSGDHDWRWSDFVELLPYAMIPLVTKRASQ